MIIGFRYNFLLLSCVCDLRFLSLTLSRRSEVSVRCTRAREDGEPDTNSVQSDGLDKTV
jgi:hypothetical protein